MESEERLEHHLNHRSERPEDPELERLMELVSWLETVPMEEPSPDLAERTARRLGQRRPYLPRYAGLVAAVLLAVWAWPRPLKTLPLGAARPQATQQALQTLGSRAGSSWSSLPGPAAPKASAPMTSSQAQMNLRNGATTLKSYAGAAPTASPATPSNSTFGPASGVRSPASAGSTPVPGEFPATVPAPTATLKATAGGGIAPSGTARTVPTPLPPVRAFYLPPVSLVAGWGEAGTGSKLRITVENATPRSLSLAGATVELESSANSSIWRLSLVPTATVPSGGSSAFTLPWPAAAGPGPYQIRLTWPGGTVAGGVYCP